MNWLWWGHLELRGCVQHPAGPGGEAEARTGQGEAVPHPQQEPVPLVGAAAGPHLGQVHHEVGQLPLRPAPVQYTAPAVQDDGWSNKASILIRHELRDLHKCKYKIPILIFIIKIRTNRIVYN